MHPPPQDGGVWAGTPALSGRLHLVVDTEQPGDRSLPGRSVRAKRVGRPSDSQAQGRSGGDPGTGPIWAPKWGPIVGGGPLTCGVGPSPGPS